MDVWLFLAVPWVCLWFVIVVFPDHTHLLFLNIGTKFYLNPFTLSKVIVGYNRRICVSLAKIMCVKENQS